MRIVNKICLKDCWVHFLLLPINDGNNTHNILQRFCLILMKTVTISGMYPPVPAAWWSIDEVTTVMGQSAVFMVTTLPAPSHASHHPIHTPSFSNADIISSHSNQRRKLETSFYNYDVSWNTPLLPKIHWKLLPPLDIIMNPFLFLPRSNSRSCTE